MFSRRKFDPNPETHEYVASGSGWDTVEDLTARQAAETTGSLMDYIRERRKDRNKGFGRRAIHAMITGRGRQDVISEYRKERIESSGRWQVLSEDVYRAVNTTRQAHNGKVKRVMVAETATRFSENDGMYYKEGDLISAGSVVITIGHEDAQEFFPNTELDGYGQLFIGFFVDYDNPMRADSAYREKQHLPKIPKVPREGEYRQVGIRLGVKRETTDNRTIFAPVLDGDRLISKSDGFTPEQMGKLLGLAERIDRRALKVNKYSRRRK